MHFFLFKSRFYLIYRWDFFFLKIWQQLLEVLQEKTVLMMMAFNAAFFLLCRWWVFIRLCRFFACLSTKYVRGEGRVYNENQSVAKLSLLEAASALCYSTFWALLLSPTPSKCSQFPVDFPLAKRKWWSWTWFLMCSKEVLRLVESPATVCPVEKCNNNEFYSHI